MIKFVIIISIFLILIEFYKLSQMKKHWVEFIKYKTFKSLSVDIIYVCLSIFLLFTEYWYVGTILIILTLTTTLFTLSFIKNQKRFTPNFFIYLISDTTISIFVLLSVLYFGLVKIL